MTMIRMLAAPAAALALGLTAAPALAQDAEIVDPTMENECQFLERSFQEVYDGMRENRRQTGGMGDPVLISMYVEIQQNAILMHQARGCNISDLIAIAREEAARYSEEFGESHGGN